MALFFAASFSGSPGDTPLTRATDYRQQMQQGHRKQTVLWVLGLVALVVLLLFFSAGFFLYPALVVGLLFILSLVTASLSLLGVQIHRIVSRTEIKLGESVDVRLLVENKKAFPASWVFWRDFIDTGLDVEGASCHFKTIGSHDKQELVYHLHSLRRGLFRVGPTLMETSGPVGLVRRFLVGPTVDFLTVLPRVVEIHRGVAQGQRPVHEVPRRRSIFEDPSRFIGMREYQPGDSMRRIHWRATARSGILQVKLFEPAVLTGMILAVDMGLASYPLSRTQKKDVDPILELAVSAAVSLAQYVLNGDQEVGLISNGTDAAELYREDWQGGTFQRLDHALAQTQLSEQKTAYQPVEIPAGKGIGQQKRMYMGLARLMPSASVRLPDLLRVELPRLPRNKVLMIITPLLDAALYEVLESIKRSGIEAGVIWIRLAEDFLPVPGGLPRHVPLYIVKENSDIEALGGQRL